MNASTDNEVAVAEPRPSSSVSKHSQAVQDYVKAIYLLTEPTGASGDATGSAISARLQVSPASVTAMLRKLDESDLINYAPYQPVTLTRRGRAVALEVIRHHRLIELFLHDTLGMSWDEIHDEAEILEHFISERLEARIAERLGHPEFDPHGDPIPALDGSLPIRPTASIISCELGVDHVVARVLESNSDKLRYLEQLGIMPGAQVSVTSVAPFEGPITITNHRGEQHALAFELAQSIEISTERGA